MEERKFIRLKKEEYGIKEYIKRDLGKGKISKLDIEYTPIGEKIVIHTSKPGLVIGKRGEKIEDLTTVLRNRFKLENPHIEIKEITNPLFDAQLVADEIALALERMGNLKFKVIAYRKLQEIIKAGALGCEIRISGKLPSERARSWRFSEGYLKKAGDSTKEVDYAQSTALTKTGMIGVKVSIMGPTAKIDDKIDVDESIKQRIKPIAVIEEKQEEKTRKRKEEDQKNEESSLERAFFKKETSERKSEKKTSEKIEKERSAEESELKEEKKTRRKNKK